MISTMLASSSITSIFIVVVYQGAIRKLPGNCKVFVYIELYGDGEVAQAFQSLIGNSDMTLHLEESVMQQINQFGWRNQDILNHFSRINLLFSSFAHIMSQIPPDFCDSTRRIRKHMREQLDLFWFSTIPRFLHQFPLRSQ